MSSEDTWDESMSEWCHISLSEIIEVRHGYAFPGDYFSSDISYPIVLTPGNFAIGGGFRTASPKTFTGDYPEEFQLDPGSLVISMTDLSKSGDTLGLPAVVPDGLTYLHNQRIGLVKVLQPLCALEAFLHYYLRTKPYRQFILATASGSTVRHTSPSRIGSFEATLPALSVQRAIAEILGALDDKMAANSTLAATANLLSSTLFEQTLPQAAVSSSTFEDLAEIGGGGTPKTSVPEYWDGNVLWATPTDITALPGPYLHETARRISDAGLLACSSPRYPAGSILMTSRATIGALAIATKPTAVNQGFIVVDPHDQRIRWWIFHEMQSRVDEFVARANGATFLELSRGKFRKFTVRLADETVMHKFNVEATALHDAARAALVETRQLAALRDTLLPQLMSGKLRVKDAEKRVEEVV